LRERERERKKKRKRERDSHNTEWTVDFEMPVGKLNLLFISADAAQEKEKKRRKCCCPLVFQSLQPIQYYIVFFSSFNGYLEHKRV
jgi:hypothetical protein